jgi:putative ABC transport system substrate-binding protein
MRRRGFIRLIGGAVAAWPIVAHAQRTVLPRIGVLVPASPEPFWSEFRAGLRERGFVEGQNIALELRSGQGKLDRLRDLADELVRLKIEIIVAHQTPAVIAARHATSEIPIVMGGVGDPVGTGLISSLARPGGNITGLSATSAETGAKTLELSVRYCRLRDTSGFSLIQPIHSPEFWPTSLRMAVAQSALPSRRLGSTA